METFNPNLGVEEERGIFYFTHSGTRGVPTQGVGQRGVLPPYSDFGRKRRKKEIIKRAKYYFFFPNVWNGLPSPQ